MVFNDTTNKTGIIQHIEDICNLGDGYISGTTTELVKWTNRINRIAHRVWHIIFMSTRNWDYDDGNQTNLPSSKTNLVTDQRKYILPTEALTIQRVEVLDENDLWYEIKPLSKEQIGGGLDEFMDVSGVPNWYRLVGNTIEIYPASNYNKTNGMRVYFDRDSVDFATTDTTKTPGFASPYHEILLIKASIEFFKIKFPTSPTLGLLLQDEERLEKSIVDFYGARFKVKKSRIGRAKQCYK